MAARAIAKRALIVLLIVACRTSTGVVVADRLFFGQNIPAGGTVSEEQWQQVEHAAGADEEAIAAIANEYKRFY